ncbi:bifunctional 2',3'-cyclic-nucleotide 2'-phosphodiesterase/3'-nucleotidase [Jeotgalibacillus sp. JSM ZJ347]|uniref:bifunctional 2',3'-cyclic-nucleotide 2'-phosphodiesterase/3'-nucleotidase n=1 Tax=Jeotgalibacillus sp. JSM ZJ347 TaxID=3342117 RepID=UPI0035A97EA2
MKKLIVAGTVMSLGLIGAFMTQCADAAEGDQVKLRVMETTDTHTNLFPYDYYRGTENQKVGFLKTATLIKEARAEAPNNVLVDNGDTIQGTPLGTYFAKVEPVAEGEVHPVIEVMNALQYDMVTLGNHEFNYGLEFMEKVYGEADFGYVSANTYMDDGDDNPDNDQPAYDPYKIVEKAVIDENGEEQTIRIGYIGFVAPQIVQWDKAHLDGKIVTKDIAESAEKYVPQMKEEGADVIIAIAHTGFDQAAVKGDLSENAVLPLSMVEGIDAITFSHTHDIFPAPAGVSLGSLFTVNGEVPDYIDAEKGTINGVAAVEAGFGGAYLGVIDLTLEEVNGEWEVTDSQSENRSIAGVEADEEIAALVEEAHRSTIEYTEGKLGTTTAPIHSYFALVQDDPSVQVVTDAQKWYVEEYIRLNSPEYQDTPLLSAGAPFKAGRNGINEYTDIETGDLTIRSAGDLYLYDNTLKALLLNGSEVRQWLEMSAGKFNQINPDSTDVQNLLNPDFPSYNFDVIDGVTYQIDVTQPAKYNADGTLHNASASRIVDLAYNGEPVADDQEFIVITNNYRAGGGGNFPNLANAEMIVDSAEENRQILMDYITEKGEINPSADMNWSIAPVKEDVKVSFLSSPTAEKYASDRITYTGEKNADGFGIFELNLNAEETQMPTFTDVPSDHWAYEEITSLVENGVIFGKSDTIFAPDEDINRIHFVSMLLRGLGLADENTTKQEIMQIASDERITFERPNYFRPYDSITRAEMAAFMVRTYKYSGGTGQPVKKEPFTDTGDLYLLQEEIQEAYELGLISGYNDGSYKPLERSKRSHAARMIYVLWDKLQ